MVLGISAICMVLVYAVASIHINKFITVNELSTIIKTVIMPESEGALFLENKVYQFILPPKTALLQESAQYKKYFTLTSYPELQQYYTEVLPKTGWQYVDQLGSGFVLQKDDITLISSRRTFLKGIEIVTFSIKRKK